MRKIFKKATALGRKGFTLIELLIVIAIIGILAVGLLIALDPVDQARKGADSNTLRTASEVKSAITRTYVSTTCWPWQTLSGTTCTNAVGCVNGAVYVLGAPGCGATVSTALVASGELKSYSSTLISLLVNDGTTTSWQVAFQPTSKSVATSSVLKYTTTACSTPAGVGATGICAAAGSACQYCIAQ